VFEVPFAGSLPLLYASRFVFIAANLALGLVFSTVAKTQQQAMQMSFFFLLPNILLSGFMFPFEGMPEPAQISQALPLTHYLRIVRGIVLRGAGFADVRSELAVATGILGVLVLLSVPALLEEARLMARPRSDIAPACSTPPPARAFPPDRPTAPVDGAVVAPRDRPPDAGTSVGMVILLLPHQGRPLPGRGRGIRIVPWYRRTGPAPPGARPRCSHRHFAQTAQVSSRSCTYGRQGREPHSASVG
jgi:hypothetical protein